MQRRHLKAARLAAGLPAVALGELVGITEQRVYDIERGRYRPRVDEARTWADSLGMPPSVAFPEMFAGEAAQ